MADLTAKYVPPKATPWGKKGLQAWDVRHHVPPHIVDAINTPHDHEGHQNRPLWLIWIVVKDQATPILDTVCDTPDSAVYHYGAVIEGNPTYSKNGTLTCHVERVPANHRFASSMDPRIFVGGSNKKVRPRRREGD